VERTTICRASQEVVFLPVEQPFVVVDKAQQGIKYLFLPPGLRSAHSSECWLLPGVIRAGNWSTHGDGFGSQIAKLIEHFVEVGNKGDARP